MNIVLVCINNFQDYILINIEQLIKLKHDNIFVITNNIFFDKFLLYKNKINLIDVESLNDCYNFFKKTKLDKHFRNGFWALTSLRFFYIYSLMEKHDLKDVIHLENDVLIYYNINILEDKFNKQKLFVPFDSFNRNIASIMYIPSSDIFKKILDNYDFTKNDMEIFSIIKKNNNLIENLPIFPYCFDNNLEVNFVCNNFNSFDFIFDAAAIGQYLGGVDPKNNSKNTVGFVNETCVIKYNNYEFIWKEDENIKRQFLLINKIKYTIFNLHIHSKNL